MAIGRNAIEAGANCTMHFMGTGIGLATSLHVLAAVGGRGSVELDANNPLRSEITDWVPAVEAGTMLVSSGGIGVAVDMDALFRYAVGQLDI